jgi:site-specific DNA-methyltransferase (adenine-specific)
VALIDTIIQGDCLEVMKDIPSKSVGLVLADMPYGALHKGNPNTMWDVEIPMQPMWEQVRRVIRNNGAVLLFGQNLFSAKLIMSNPDMFRYSLVWDKMRCTGFLNANRMPLRGHEDIHVFYYTTSEVEEDLE